MRNYHKKSWKSIWSLLLALGLVLSLLTPLAPSAEAAQVLPESIGIAQSQRGTCTLASATMMIRARMYLSGDGTWESVTEQSVRPNVWMEGVGVYYSWSHTTASGSSFSGEYAALSGISEAALSALLDQHPEGIELYCAGVPHAVLVIDYTDGIFYCFDPAESYSCRRIPISDSWLGANLGSQSSILANATAYWYLSEYHVKANTDIPTVSPTPTPSTAPEQVTITEQPESQAGVLGDKVTFSVKATGSGKLSYQWEYSRDGVNWQRSSATGRSVTCRLNETTVGSYYRCVVSDSYGQSVRTHAAQLVLSEPPVITAQPSDQVGAAGKTVTFEIAAEGEDLAYQWQYSDDGGMTWKDSRSQTERAEVTVMTSRDGRVYRCIVTNAYGQQTVSTNASVRVSSTLKITAQPDDTQCIVGEKAQFSVTAAGDGLTYQWQYSDNNGKSWKDSSSTTAAASVSATNARSGRLYRCIVTDRHGTQVISRAAKMTVTEPITITQQPADYTGVAGETASFTVTATGNGLSYQWQYSDDGGKSWADSSVKQATAAVKITSVRNGRLYRCVITDQNGTTLTSASAKMRVAAVKITAQPKSITAAKHSIVRFRITAAGEGLSYQWQISTDGKTWANASTNEQLTWIATASANGRMVRCIVTDVYGNQATSKTVKLNVT